MTKEDKKKTEQQGKSTKTRRYFGWCSAFRGIGKIRMSGIVKKIDMWWFMRPVRLPGLGDKCPPPPPQAREGFCCGCVWLEQENARLQGIVDAQKMIIRAERVRAQGFGEFNAELIKINHAQNKTIMKLQAMINQIKNSGAVN